MKLIEDAQETLEIFHKYPHLALDLETSGRHHVEDDIAVFSIASDQTDEVAVLHTYHTGIPEPLRELLSLDNLFITQNGTTFDLPFLLQSGIKIKNHYDILIAEQVLNTSNRRDTRNDLGAIMERRIGQSFKRSVDHGAWTAPSLTHDQKLYAASDTAFLVKIYKIQQSLARQRKLVEPLDHEQKLTTRMAQIINNGMAFSHDTLQEKREAMYDNLLIYQHELEEEFGWGFNPRSSQEVISALGSIGIDISNSQQGTLKPIAEHNPTVQKILDVRQASKRTGFYDENFEQKYVKFGRIYTKYWQLGTNTTRYSSSDPNLQQIPKNMRSFIGNEPGHKVVASDFSQIEIFIAASITRDSNLIEALDSEDFHAYMAQQMFDLNYIPILEIEKDTRNDGKAGTFTWVFAGGENGIIEMGKSAGKVIPNKRARGMILHLQRRFPGVTRWHRSKRNKVSKRFPSKVRLPWGHQRVFLPGQQSVQKFVNTEVQGTAAIGLKESILEADRRGLLEYIGGLVHDEIVATSVPDEEAIDFARELEDAMKAGMAKVCNLPVRVESEIDDAWKDKEALPSFSYSA